jgi:hypothetical protein
MFRSSGGRPENLQTLIHEVDDKMRVVAATKDSMEMFKILTANPGKIVNSARVKLLEAAGKGI